MVSIPEEVGSGDLAALTATAPTLTTHEGGYTFDPALSTSPCGTIGLSQVINRPPGLSESLSRATQADADRL
jgi:hypothetical protein